MTSFLPPQNLDHSGHAFVVPLQQETIVHGVHTSSFPATIRISLLISFMIFMRRIRYIQVTYSILVN